MAVSALTTDFVSLEAAFRETQASLWVADETQTCVAETARPLPIKKPSIPHFCHKLLIHKLFSRTNCRFGVAKPRFHQIAIKKGTRNSLNATLSPKNSRFLDSTAFVSIGLDSTDPANWETKADLTRTNTPEMRQEYAVLRRRIHWHLPTTPSSIGIYADTGPQPALRRNAPLCVTVTEDGC